MSIYTPALALVCAGLTLLDQPTTVQGMSFSQAVSNHEHVTENNTAYIMTSWYTRPCTLPSAIRTLSVDTKDKKRKTTFSGDAVVQSDKREKHPSLGIIQTKAPRPPTAQSYGFPIPAEVLRLTSASARHSAKDMMMNAWGRILHGPNKQEPEQCHPAGSNPGHV